MRRIPVLVVGGVAAWCLLISGCSSGSQNASGSLVAASSSKADSSTAPDPAASPASAGSSAPSPSAPTAPPNVAGDETDACSLMTAAQASEINEVTYSGTSPQHVTTGYEQCTYSNGGKSVDPVNIYDLEVGVVSVDGCYQQFKDVDGPGTAVPGVGEAAFGYQIGITVQDGSTCIQVEGSTHAELQGDYSHDVAMAKLILAKLH